MSQPTLLLVDASSFVYRAFHAMPDLRSRSGLPTGAITGVINMLRRLRQDWPADFIACVFDPKGPHLSRCHLSGIQGQSICHAR